MDGVDRWTIMTTRAPVLLTKLSFDRQEWQLLRLLGKLLWLCCFLCCVMWSKQLLHHGKKKSKKLIFEKAWKQVVLLGLIPSRGASQHDLRKKLGLWIMIMESRFPCCVLSYFSLVFVMKHWQIQVIRVSWVGQSTIGNLTMHVPARCFMKF